MEAGPGAADWRGALPAAGGVLRCQAIPGPARPRPRPAQREQQPGAGLALPTKKLMMASVQETNAENEKDARVAKALKGKVLRMKEDITKEAVRRAAAMHDRTEADVLGSVGGGSASIINFFQVRQVE